MGNRNSSESSHHPRLGTVRKDQKGRLTTKVDVHQLEDLNKWQAGLARVKLFANQYLFTPVYHKVNSKGFNCSTSDSVDLEYDNYFSTLKNDVLDRQTLTKHYTGAELLRFAYIYAKSAKDFQLYGQKLGNINPQNVLLNSENNLKIFHRYSRPNEPFGIQKILQDSTGSFLSPQELSELQKRKVFINSSHQTGQNDAFALGMTLLQLGTLQSSEDLYNYFQSTIDETELNRRVNKFNGIYSKDNLLNRILKELLAKYNRVTCGQLFSVLQEQQFQVLRLQPLQDVHWDQAVRAFRHKFKGLK